MGHDPVEEQLEAYALGALEPSEAASVERHLAGCASCRRVLTEYEAVAAGLPVALSHASPLRLHPALKQRVLRAVDRDARPSPARRWWRVLAIAAAVALPISLAANYALASMLAHQRAVQTELVGKIVHDQATVFDVVDSQATTKRVLRSSTESGPSAPYGKVFSRSDSADVVAMVNRLPQPPAGQRYQLFLTANGGGITTAGTLGIDEEGFSYLVFRSDRVGPIFTYIEVRLGSQSILSWEGSR